MTEIIVRPVRPEDQAPLIALVKRILLESDAQKAPYFNEAFWRWQCLTPGFESVVTVAEHRGELVGSFHLVSREMFFKGKRARMVLLHDLGVLKEYRRRGLFLRLARCAVEHVTRHGWELTYSLPNALSYPGFIKHLGYRHVTVAPVRVRPLQPGALLSERFPHSGFWNVMGRSAVALYDLPFPLRKPDPELPITPAKRFTEAVDALSRQFVARAGLGCTRDRRFLNWRFVDHPAVEYGRWTIGRRNQPLAYLVTRRARLFGTEVLLLMDMACADGAEDALLVLISERLGRARREGLAMAVLTGLHPFFPGLRRLGFMKIPEVLNPRPMNFIVRAHVQGLGQEIYDPTRWCISLADLDIL